VGPFSFSLPYIERYLRTWFAAVMHHQAVGLPPSSSMCSCGGGTRYWTP